MIEPSHDDATPIDDHATVDDPALRELARLYEFLGVDPVAAVRAGFHLRDRNEECLVNVVAKNNGREPGKP